MVKEPEAAYIRLLFAEGLTKDKSAGQTRPVTQWKSSGDANDMFAIGEPDFSTMHFMSYNMVGAMWRRLAARGQSVEVGYSELRGNDAEVVHGIVGHHNDKTAYVKRMFFDEVGKSQACPCCGKQVEGLAIK